ncbi:exodeoxyribonuclease VII large subunit [Candidatus Azambacteria bacterium]|nr:exodeoxyribonuclease VII large subunit [Candidatus Azambacteria bacterium]
MTNLKIFSVAEYVAYLNEALSERDAVVEGEISEYKINQSKWIFFKVKDEEATLECFSTVFKLRLPLEDGMRVRVYGRPGIYAKSGKFSMTVEWAEPAGEGALKRSFELLKAELEKEGLFAAARKRPLPRFPKKIALVASKESAAYGDFTKILKQRFGGLEVFLYHVQVQGGEAIADIQKAFSYFNAHHKELGIEAVALVRGGGSLEDLAAFNSR